MFVGAAFHLLGFNFLLSQCVFHITFKNHFFSVTVRSIVAFDRFDHFSVFRSTWLLKSCYYFLCHGYLISLCTVYFLMIELYFFNSIRSGVFFLFFVVMYRLVPGRPLFLCSVHSRITWTLFPFFAILFCLFQKGVQM